MPDVKIPATYGEFIKAQNKLDNCDPDSSDYRQVAQAYWHAVAECIANAPEEFGIAQRNAERNAEPDIPCILVPFRVLEAALEALEGELARSGPESFKAATNIKGGQEMHPRAAGAARCAVRYCIASRDGLTGDRFWRKTIRSLFNISDKTLINWEKKYPNLTLTVENNVGGFEVSAEQIAQVYKRQLEQAAQVYKKFGTGDWN